MSAALVEVSGLSKSFPVRRGLLQGETAEFRAVDAVDLEILKGETLGLELTTKRVISEDRPQSD